MKKLFFALLFFTSLNSLVAGPSGGYFGSKWTIGGYYTFSSGMMIKSLFSSSSYSSMTNFGVFGERTLNRKNSIVLGFQNYYSLYPITWNESVGGTWGGNYERYYTISNVVRSTKYIGYKFSFLRGGNVNPIGWYYMLGLSQTSIKAEILANELPKVFKSGYNSDVTWFSVINEIGKVIPITKSVSMLVALDFTIKAPKYLSEYTDGNLGDSKTEVQNSMNLNILLHNDFRFENTLVIKGGLNYHF